MATPGSFFRSHTQGHQDNLEVRHHPRANTSQWQTSRFNFPHPEVGGAAGLGGLQEVQDYVEVRNTQTTAVLLEVLAKFEERYSCKTMHCSRNSGNAERRGWNESRRSNHDDRQRNWKNSEVLHKPSNSRNNYRGNYESGRQRNQWFESRNELNRDDRRFDIGYQSGNRVQSENFSRGDRRNRGSSTNFSRGKGVD
ncbi:uncharacterized protein TNCV_4089491 [Trichonephila clavipes]|nr:uncharacterized protein TNCV_4089491 [Trichonephila clavipes]